ncbi:hypothetical protein JTB14_027509 [Gonioctena quinquepunctata]|nr:hypothetical protein JTB14_027509 [Gonioctena quinquepunctata]
MTLVFYSRKAYDYFRKTIKLCLPYPSTKSEKEELIFPLIIDEMAMNKQVISDGKYGHVNFGYDNTDDFASIATEALIFLEVCHTEHWKITIGYFLIRALVEMKRLADGDVKITWITCDGIC